MLLDLSAVNAVFPEVRLSLGTHLDPPSEAVLLQLRQMLLAASPHHVARKLTLGPDASEKQRRQMKRAYAVRRGQREREREMVEREGGRD